MASLQQFVLKIKPAMDAFLRGPSQSNLANMERELVQFDWMQMKIFHVQILVPLVLKLDEMSGYNQELQAGTMNCIRFVTSKLYLNDVKGLRTMLIIVLKQIRERDSATTKANLSEEIKLAAVQCIAEALRRSTTDVLEQFYTKESAMLLGQILLTLVEFVEKEKYRKLVITAMQCLMVSFYVHDEADSMDVVLRNQVANILFIFLPKVVTILFKTSLADEKLGETLKATAIKALARVLRVMYEETTEAVVNSNYNMHEFKKLIDDALKPDPFGHNATDADILGSKKSNEELEERLQRMQGDGRSPQWFGATSRKLRVIFVETSILRSHTSTRIRREYAQMCCSLLQHCAHNLKDNFIFLLENVVAMSEDEEGDISCRCREAIQQLQDSRSNEGIFDENSEILFDEHLMKLPRIINRCDEAEQYAELLFLKGFLRNLSARKLRLLLSMPRNLEMFCMCLLAAVDMKITHDLLNEDYSLRQMNDADFVECSKLHWRQYKHLNSLRCIETLKEICSILGRSKALSRIIFDFFLDLLRQQTQVMNEILLIMLWMATAQAVDKKGKRFELVEVLLEELLNEKNWHLALQPDQVWRLKVDKHSDWYVDRTPGLYESAIEIRKQDYDSDDENDSDNVDSRNRVTIVDAQFNVLHTCIILDGLAHCALFLGETFDKYLFRSLHRVLLKIASTNSIIYQAANFTLISIQKALRFAKTSHLIETHTDYITYHLNTILKRSPESRSAVDILTVVLQFSTRNALPHLDSIFQTIRGECTKAHQTENIISYLKVFHAFLAHVSHWQCKSDREVNDIDMQVDGEQEENDLVASWLSVLEKPAFMDEELNPETPKEMNGKETESMSGEVEAEEEDNTCDIKPTLPRHIEMIKDILNQVLKFLSSSEKIHQILALECLISGLPLLCDYENELLPLVHLIWSPLVEKFRQKDPVVLNRCFTLLHILATHAKEFILKRSLDDVIPFLKQFLKEAAAHSAVETITAQTQEYKLQLKLLQEFASLIQSMQVDGKNLNEIAEVISLYLSHDQPTELQDYAVQFYNILRLYNGPLVYLVVLKKSHLKDYKVNVTKVLLEFGIKC